VRLWVHEAERTYGDRLVNEEHLAIYRNMVTELVKKQFTKFNLSKYLGPGAKERLIFCHFA